MNREPQQLSCVGETKALLIPFCFPLRKLTTLSHSAPSLYYRMLLWDAHFATPAKYTARCADRIKHAVLKSKAIVPLRRRSGDPKPPVTAGKQESPRFLANRTPTCLVGDFVQSHTRANGDYVLQTQLVSG